MTMRTSFLQYLAFALLGTTVTGCGNPSPMVPVSGRISMDDSPLPTAGTVYFTPIEAFGGHPLRPASANFETDGNYSVSSFADAEGLFPGEYRVHVHCWEIPPTMDGPPARSYLPPKYDRPNTSGLALIVKEGSPAIEFNVDIQPER